MIETVQIVLVTAPDEPVARHIAQTIVTEQLAACANIVPRVTSIYRWEGVVQEDSEVLMIIKTTATALDALTARVLDLHPYAVAEVIALPIGAGAPAYLDWVVQSTKGGSDATFADR